MRPPFAKTVSAKPGNLSVPPLAGGLADRERKTGAKVLGSLTLNAAPRSARRNWWRRLINTVDRFRRLSASFISGLIHTLLIILLAALATIQSGPGKPSFEIDSGLIVDANTDQPDFELFSPSNSPAPDEPTQSSAYASAAQATLSQSLLVQNTSAEAVTLASPAPAKIELDSQSWQGTVDVLKPLPSAFAHSSLDGRSQENRTKLALTMGGTKASEQAVEAALVWLTAHQHRDGGWSMNLQDPNGTCLGKCSASSIEPGQDGKRFAATGLALLTYLGAGYTHREGKYQDQVYRGLMFLMDHIQLGAPNPNSPRFPGQFASVLSKHQMYEQGIATLALCEAYQMTKDQLLAKTAQQAVDFILEAQHYDGSWGYYRKTPGDLSIVGWQMMSLKSAHAAELEVDTVRIRRVDHFLDLRQTNGGARYCYRGTEPTRSMTAIGLLMRVYLGHPTSMPQFLAGASYVAEKGPSENDAYFNYYATQALFQLKSERWKKWNASLREYLIKTQSKSGHETGSWFFENEPFNYIGGRLYTTALAAMTLEVYYRYMPVYKDAHEVPFKL